MLHVCSYWHQHDSYGNEEALEFFTCMLCLYYGELTVFGGTELEVFFSSNYLISAHQAAILQLKYYLLSLTNRTPVLNVIGCSQQTIIAMNSHGYLLRYHRYFLQSVCCCSGERGRLQGPAVFRTDYLNISATVFTKEKCFCGSIYKQASAFDLRADNPT